MIFFPFQQLELILSCISQENSSLVWGYHRIALGGLPCTPPPPQFHPCCPSLTPSLLHGMMAFMSFENTDQRLDLCLQLPASVHIAIFINDCIGGFI